MNPPAPRTRRTLLVAAALAAICLASYHRVLSAGFINFDDDLYVYENPHVLDGLTLSGVKGAFTTTLGNHYQPLTVLSFMLDAQLYGMNPAGFHLTNLLLHILNVVLLLILLYRMTGSFWPSAMVAALFAIHPLRVESVAWVTERKDVLSTFFWFLSMLAYLDYLRKPGLWRMTLVFAALALGLMAKQMPVTAPFLLLLLDHWPLGRKGSLAGRVLEKLPLFLLAGVFIFLALYFVQFGVVALDLQVLPLGDRIGNGLVSYLRYIGKMFWPAELLIFYPHPAGNLPAWQPIGAALLLALISGLTVWQIRARPYLFVGWFWYLGTLFPLIGLAQTGQHALGDRFVYVPMIGLFIMLTWGVRDLARWLIPAAKPQRIAAGALAGLIIVLLGVRTWIQTGHWRDSVSIYQPVIRAGVVHFMIDNNLGLALLQRGEIQPAMKYFRRALAQKPQNPRTHMNLGLALVHGGRIDRAIEKFRTAIRLDPGYADAYDNLAIALYLSGDYPGAWKQVQACRRLGGRPHPDFVRSLKKKLSAARKS